jgi:Uma2 family endonuclease
MEANTLVYETQFDNEFSISEDVGSLNHSKLQARITTALNNDYGDEYEALTEISLDLPTGTVEPDVAVFPLIEDDWKNDVVKTSELPILVIEILSPKQLLTDVADKIVKTYLKAGIKSVWLIIPTYKTIYVIHSKDEESTFTHGRVIDPVSGIELDIDAIFRRRIKK